MIFWNKFAQKGYYRSKTEKLSTTIEFCISEESAKLRAWHARVLCVFTCLWAHVIDVFACSRAWRTYMLGVFTYLCAYVLACSRAWCVCVLGMLACLVCLRIACLRICYGEIFIFLRVCVLSVIFCLICFTFQYFNLKILTAKNLCALLSWTCFFFTFW